MIELEAIMFKCLYVLMATHNHSLFSNFLDFLDLCSFTY
jgi:hypothetical protein